MTFPSRLWSLMLAGSLALGGCAVVPVDEYGYYEDDYGYYERDTVIVTPPPRVEYRGLPPVSSYIWIDGYWNWVGHRHDWVPGYWAPPGTRPRAIVQHRQFERHRDDDRRERWWGDSRRDRDGDRRRADGRRDQRADDQREERRGDWRGDRNADRNEDRRGDRIEAIRDRDGVRDRDRDRDGARDRDARRDRSEDRERAVVRERERRIDQNQAQPGLFTRPQFTPRERIQAESERKRLDNQNAREERRTIRRDDAPTAARSEERRRRSDGDGTTTGERRGDERGRPDWRERMREAGAN